MDLRITKLAGDGIGPEVVNEAVKVCDSVAKKFNHNIIYSMLLTFLGLGNITPDVGLCPFACSLV